MDDDEKLDQEVLEQLRDSFDTYRVLDAIGDVDKMRERIGDPRQMRTELFAIHGLACQLINHNHMIGPFDDEGAPLWQRAFDLQMELYEYADSLHRVADMLGELAALAPQADLGIEEDEPLSDS